MVGLSSGNPTIGRAYNGRQSLKPHCRTTLGANQAAITAQTGSSGNTGARKLTLGGTNTGQNTFNQTINDLGSGSNITSLTKNDAGTWVLTGNNTYSGGTTISSGTLATGATGNFGTGNVTISAAVGTLTLGNANSIADTATLSLFSGSSLFLNFDGTEQIGGLTVAGTALTNNDVSTSVNFGTNRFSAADLKAKGYTNASGTGLLQIGASAIPEPSTYAAFAGLGILGFAVYRRRRRA